MIKTKKDLKEYLMYEYQKYFKSKNNLLNKIILRNISEKQIIWRFQKYLRIYEYYFNNNKKIRRLLFKYLLNKIGLKYGLHIPPNVFEKGLKIMHLGPILINERSKIGENCSIHINTAIVAGGINDLAPIIGDNCIIGVGSIVLGNVTIGENCVIGAGAVVNKSFESNVTIAGVPAKIISNNNSEKWRK